MLDHLPERDRPAVKQRLRRAWARDDHARALDQLRALAGELERSHPGAAGSLREGMEETLTLTRLGITRLAEAHARVDEPVRVDDRDRPPHQPQRQALAVGRDGLRWTAAGMLEAERQFRKIIGYRDLAKLAVAIERDLAAARDRSHPDQGGRYRSSPPDHHTGTAVTKFHGERDILSVRECRMRVSAARLATVASPA